LVGGSVRRRRSRGAAVRVWSAHWSGGGLGLVAIEAHPDRGAHHLSLWCASVIVAATSTSSTTAISSVGRGLLRMGSPLLDGRAAGRRRSWIRLAVGRLGSRLVLGLGAVCRLLLVHLRGIVRVVVLGRQRGVRCTLRGVLLSMLGVPRLLRGLGVARLGRRTGVRGGRLGTVGGLLAIGVAWVRLVVAAAIGATTASATMTAARGTVRGIAAGAAARRGRWRSRRRGSVVVGHAR
jgi:hypothetical protein